MKLFNAMETVLSSLDLPLNTDIDECFLRQNTFHFGNVSTAEFRQQWINIYCCHIQKFHESKFLFVYNSLNRFSKAYKGDTKKESSM